MSILPATWWHDLAPIRLADSIPSSDGFHRSWVMLMPQRTYKTERYGTLDFSEAALKQYKQSFDARARGIEIALDVDHQAPQQNKTAAYGWIEQVQLGEAIQRKPGLWALVRWTPLGLADVQNQIYRYISAEIQPGTWRNEVSGKTHTHVLFGATLTNRPVLKDIEPVVLSGDGKRGKRRNVVGRGGGMAGYAEDEDDEQNDEFVTLDDGGMGDDTEEYAEGDDGDAEDALDGGADETEEDTAAAAKAQAKAKGKSGSGGKKSMSELEAGSVTMAEHLALVEEVRALKRDKYAASVDKLLGGWEAGKQQFAEHAGKRPNGEAAKPNEKLARPVRVVLSRPAFKAAKALMLSEAYADLSEDLRGAIAKVIELAATGTVDLSVRGGSNTTEATKTVKLSTVAPESDAAAFDAAWHENAVALAEAGGDDYNELVVQSRKGNRAAAVKVEAYQRQAHKQTLAG